MRASSVLLLLITYTAIATGTFVGASTTHSRHPLPVAFEENHGQFDPAVRFASSARGYRVFLTDREAVIAGTDGAAVRLGLSRTNSARVVQGINPLPGRSHYLIGPDPKRWHTGVPQYGRVLYSNAYPGVDIVWYGDKGRIEHDFIVHAGADPQRIRLSIEGAAVKLDSDGGLTAGSVRLHRPRAFQDGHEIECRYELRGRTVRFALGPWDHTRSLTIDPVLSYSTYLGGSDNDQVNAIAVDQFGNAYVAGATASADFPVSPDALQKKLGGGACGGGSPLGMGRVPCAEGFVAKLNRDGNTLVFSTYLGGSGGNNAAAVAVDGTGGVYVAGSFGPGFPLSSPAPNPLGGSFVAKLRPDGAALEYSTPIPGFIRIAALAVDAAGAAYFSGGTTGGLPVVNAFQATHADADLWKTTDGGANWQALMEDFHAVLTWAITVSPSDSQTLYASIEKGAYRSIEDGAYRSRDGGVHWTAINNGLDLKHLPVWCFEVDPADPLTVYAGTLLGDVFKTSNGGASWTSSSTGLSGTPYETVRVIVVDPKTPSTLYAATNTALYKSTDGAATWKPTGLIGPSGGPSYVNAVVLDPATPTTVYAGTAAGVMKSTDGGATWKPMTTGFLQFLSIDALAIDPLAPQKLYAAASVNLGVYRSTDGGEHWTLARWPSSPDVRALLVDPVLSSRIWAATGRGLLVSHDSGVTWGPAPLDLPHQTIYKLAADRAGALYALTGDSVTSDDAFVAKLDPSGSTIVYSTYLGGHGTDDASGIAVDAAGRAYVTGWTDSPDFPVKDALEPHHPGDQDAFVTVLDATGRQLVWSTYIGGSGTDSASGIALDPAGNVHIAGRTTSTDFPVVSAAQPRPGGYSDAFAAKLKGDGSALIYSTYFGGSGDDSASGVAADAAGNTYVAGITSSNDIPLSNALQGTLAGETNVFLAALNSRTGALQYATYLGGSHSDIATAVAADADGDAYVAGYTSSPDFPRRYALQYGFAGGNDFVFGPFTGTDAFVAKISASGNGPVIGIGGVVNGASYANAIAPGAIVSIFGTALAERPSQASATPLPGQLADVRVFANGTQAPLFYASPLQVNAQLPFDIPPGNVEVEVRSIAGTAHIRIVVGAIGPGIFSRNMQGSGPGAILHGVSLKPVTDSDPASPGEIISIYCTGLGAVNPPVEVGNVAPSPAPVAVITPEVKIGGQPAHVSFAGLAPGFAGLYQVNAEIPAGVPAGAQEVVVSSGGTNSNTVTVAVH